MYVHARKNASLLEDLFRQCKMRLASSYKDYAPCLLIITWLEVNESLQYLIILTFYDDVRRNNYTRRSLICKLYCSNGELVVACCDYWKLDSDLLQLSSMLLKSSDYFCVMIVCLLMNSFDLVCLCISNYFFRLKMRCSAPKTFLDIIFKFSSINHTAQLNRALHSESLSFNCHVNAV